MKHVIRYLLDGDGRTPVFVADAGHFSAGEELVGISVDDSKRHLPSSVHKVTRAELIERIETYSCKIGGEAYTTEEAAELAANFLSERGMADYE